jgi:LuxR family maltose regulon positive regulatory protein
VIARLEALLEAWARPGARAAGGREARTLDARALLAKLHWQAGRCEQAISVLQPALTMAEREEDARRLVAAGPALIPALRQAALQGTGAQRRQGPEKVGELLRRLGEAAGSWELGAGHSERRPAPSERSERQEQHSAPSLAEPLSERELEVLRLVAAGLGNAEIAAQLFLAVGTVKRHVFNLYGKLGASSRTSAVVRARELGLL